MKKVLKVLGIVIGVIYTLTAIGLIVCLLNYNDYNITEIKDKTFVIVRDDELEPSYKNGDLVIVKKNDNKDIHVGEKIFFYSSDEKQITINLGTVVEKEQVTEKEVKYVLNGDYPVSSEYVLGTATTSKAYPKLGKVLAFLESRLGFLFLIIFPILLIFIYEIYAVIKEIKTPEPKHEE